MVNKMIKKLLLLVLISSNSIKIQAQTKLNYCTLLNSLISQDSLVANERVIFWVSNKNFEKSIIIKKLKCGKSSIIIIPPIKKVKSYLTKQKNFYLININNIDSVTNNIQGYYSYVNSVKYSSHSKAWIFIGAYEGGGNLEIQPNSQTVILKQ